MLSPHTTPSSSNLAGISNFFQHSLCVCVIFFRFMIVIDVFLQFPSERPRGGVQLRDWGSSLAAFCGVFPYFTLYSRLSLSVCFCFLSLILLLLSVWLLYFWHLCWLARSTALGWVLNGFCLDWRKFCGVVSVRGRKVRRYLGVACGNAKEIKCCRPCRHSLISGAC